MNWVNSLVDRVDLDIISTILRVLFLLCFCGIVIIITFNYVASGCIQWIVVSGSGRHWQGSSEFRL